MNMNVSGTTFFQYGNRFVSNRFPNANPKNAGDGISEAQGGMSLRRMLSENRQKQANSDWISQSQSYSQSLVTSREKAKDTSLKLKKLRYDFKGISAQILRSKTSASAKQAAGKARREVLRLKRQKQSGQYDEEEIQAAIVHAQAMERVAKKKARHLQEEELMKVTGGPCAGDLEEEERLKEHPEETAKREEDAVQAQEQDALQEQTKAEREMMAAQMDEFREMMQNMAEELSANLRDKMAESMQDMMSQMMDELWESMENLMEESGLMDLEEEMFAPGREMDPADFKMMKIKHRSEEMKLIARADSEYLKVMFDRLEKMKSGGGVPGMGSSSFGGSASLGGSVAGPMPAEVAFGGAFSTGGAPAVSIDISV